MRTLYHSRDNGQTWEAIQVNPNSIASRLVRDGSEYDDGYGNLYRTDLPQREAS